MSIVLLTTMKTIIQSYPELLLTLCCFFLLCYWHKIHRKSHVPVNWPVLGMLPGLLMNIRCLYDWSMKVLEESGCTVSFQGPWFMNMNYLFTSDPANVQHIFNVNFSNYPKGEEFSEIFEILGDGIFTADEESWQRQRMKAHKLISNRSFRSFVEHSIADKLQKGLMPLLDHVAKQGVVVNLQDVFLRLTFDSTCNLVFGVDPCGLSAEFPTIPFSKAMDDAMEALFIRHTMPPACWKLMKWLNIGEERKLVKAWIVIDEFISKRIAEKKHSSRRSTEFEEGKDRRTPDLLSSYINEDLGDAEQSADYEKFLRDTAISFILAGRDTTGAALTWFFWLLTQNRAVEAKILDELKTHLVPHKAPISSNSPIMFDTAEELNKLVYLHAALYEALRLFPPVPYEHKNVLQTDVLPSGHKVQPGMKVLVNLYCMARIEGVWGKDCFDFRPERWISAKGRIKHEPSYKFMSFNSGPRTCLGKEVAFAQMKAVAAALIWNFCFDVVEDHVVKPKLSIILQMENGLMVRVKRRIINISPKV